jgi:hypothetical protein
MDPSMVSRRVLRVLIAVALVLLVALLVAEFVLAALAWLLGTMGDDAGQTVLARVALAGGILLVIDLILLVLALGIRSLDEPGEPPEEPP